jgi:hypothetical protein
VSRVPFMAAVRPNSVTTSTAVCGHKGPNSSASACNALSRPVSALRKRSLDAALIGMRITTPTVRSRLYKGSRHTFDRCGRRFIGNKMANQLSSQ